MILDIMPIPLTQGLYALVDGEDYERLNRHKWCAQKSKNTYYAARNITIQNGKQQKVRMHREILELSKDVQADHRNGCGLDNRKVNLRPATNQQNQFNRFPQKNVSSRYKGVGWHKFNKKWQAQIQHNNERIHLGYFDSEITAAKTYDQKAKELFGGFANCNF